MEENGTKLAIMGTVKTRHNNDIDYFRAILIGLVILIHIVNFGNLYPALKDSILSFIMPSFLVITGYLVNIEKPLKGFLRYLWQIWLPYMIFVMGFAVLSLYLPVRDGIETLDFPTAAHVLFVKPLGPYWFFHAMMVCGIVYYAAFRLRPSMSVTAKFSLFAAALIAIALCTPLLSIKAAIYYFIGVGIKQYVGDFSKAYRKSLWPLIPFCLLIAHKDFHDWGTVSVVACVCCFFCFTSFIFGVSGERTRALAGYVGRNTFPIYVFHPVFTMMAKFFLPAFKFEPTGILHAAFTVVVGIAGSLYVARFMDWSHLSFLFGRERILR